MALMLLVIWGYEWLPLLNQRLVSHKRDSLGGCHFGVSPKSDYVGCSGIADALQRQSPTGSSHAAVSGVVKSLARQLMEQSRTWTGALQARGPRGWRFMQRQQVCPCHWQISHPKGLSPLSRQFYRLVSNADPLQPMWTRRSLNWCVQLQLGGSSIDTACHLQASW